MKRLFIIIFMSCCSVAGMAQDTEAGEVEVFAGADLRYADVNYVRLYNVLLNLTPGIKWKMGNDWLLSAQVFLPLINEGYETKHNVVRLTNAVLAKQLHLGNLHCKLSGGLFGLDRYGVDMRAMLPLTSWLLLQAQAGYTGYWRLAAGDAVYRYGNAVEETKAVDFGAIDCITAIGGARLWLDRWNTEFFISGGRYVNEDIGVQLDVMRHFSHCTIDLFYQLRMGNRLKSLVDEMTDRANGGFKVVMMIPPYKKSDHLRAGRVVFRPASNFRLTNNVRSDTRSMRSYTTDPEENERELNLDVNWGVRVSETLNKK
jgi:hypothetical protein